MSAASTISGTKIDGVSFDHVNADDIIIGDASTASGLAIEDITFDNVIADTIIIGGFDAEDGQAGAFWDFSGASQTSIENISFDNVNANLIIIGGFDTGSHSPEGLAQSFSGFTFDNIDFDNVHAGAIIIGSAGDFAAASAIADALSFDNVSAGEIIVGGFQLAAGGAEAGFNFHSPGLAPLFSSSGFDNIGSGNLHGIDFSTHQADQAVAGSHHHLKPQHAHGSFREPNMFGSASPNERGHHGYGHEHWQPETHSFGGDYGHHDMGHLMHV